MPRAYAAKESHFAADLDFGRLVEVPVQQHNITALDLHQILHRNLHCSQTCRKAQRNLIHQGLAGVLFLCRLRLDIFFSPVLGIQSFGHVCQRSEGITQAENSIRFTEVHFNRGRNNRVFVRRDLDELRGRFDRLHEKGHFQNAIPWR